MTIVYNVLYSLLLLILTPWLIWRVVLQRKNRRGWREKLWGAIPWRTGEHPCVWIHAVSVGEVNLLSPLVDELQRQFPTTEIFVSTTTETGYDLAKSKFPDREVFFCPLDFSWSVKNMIQRLRPNLLLLTELELWPNLISVTRRHHIPAVLINGRISQRSFNGYRWLSWPVRYFVSQLNLAIVQTNLYATRIQSLGVPPERVFVAGNIKFDSPQSDTNQSALQPLIEWAQIENDQIVFVAGSTQENEARMVISIFRQLRNHYPQLRLVLVPRHPQRSPAIVRLLESHQLPYIRRSLSMSGMPPRWDRPVVLVDVIGELRDWWQRADIGYVGGSMGSRGGQNMIEPAAAAVAMAFGPHTENFRDVVELLLAKQAAMVVHSELELKQFVVDMLNNPQTAKQMGQRAQALVLEQRGAAAKTVDLLQHCLPLEFNAPRQAA